MWLRRPVDMKRIAFMVMTLTLLAAGCGADPGVVATTDPLERTSTTATTGTDEQLGALSAAQERWVAVAPADYTVTQVDRCAGCAEEPQILAVHANEVVSLAGDAVTVDDVFGTIEQSIRDGATVNVEYHPELGYPVRVVIDLDGDGAADVDLEFGDLEAMPIVETLQELQAAARRWDAQGLESYRYIFRVDCTCDEGGTFEIDVRDGLVVAVTPLDDGARNSSLNPGFAIDSSFDDLEEWFTDSAAIIEDGILALDIRMDPEYGYPRWFRIEGEDVDGEFFIGRFTMVVTIDLIAELGPIEPDPGPDPDDLSEVEQAFGRWKEAARTDYRYVLTVHCECPAQVSGPFEVTVRDGRLESAVLGDGTLAQAEVILIADAFDQIGFAIFSGTEIDVVYDPLLGYPQLVIIDPEAVAVDGGLAFSITDFEPLG